MARRLSGWSQGSFVVVLGPGVGGIMVWPEDSTQAGDQSLPLGPALAVPFPPHLHRPGLHHGRRETSVEEELLHHSLLCLRGGEEPSNSPPCPFAPQTHSQTLSGEEARSEVTLPAFQACSAYPYRRALGTNHTPLSHSSLGSQIGVIRVPFS